MPPPSPDLPPLNAALGKSKRAQKMSYDIVWAHGMFFFFFNFFFYLLPQLSPITNDATSLPRPPPSKNISGTLNRAQMMSNDVVWAHGMFSGYVIFDRHHFSTHHMHFWPPQHIFDP